MDDKNIELNRYNTYSNNKLNEELSIEKLSLLGHKNFSKYLQAPFIKYECLINEFSIKNKNLNQLDLCCGDGIHSFTAAFNGANVIAVDFAENSIEIAKRRANVIGIPVDFRVCDVEKLNFVDEQFDIVTCVGSLSYVDHDSFLLEIKRILKPGGIFICLDSFNHNFIYRFNRYLHYLKKERSISTLNRMPNEELVLKIKSMFNNFKIYYYGTFSFFAPFLGLFLNEKKVAKLIDKLDSLFPSFKKYAFKIVFKAVK